MKREWIAFVGTLTLVGWAAMSQEKFFYYYQTPLMATDSDKISFVERVLYSAALSNAPPQPVQGVRGKQKCPEAAKASGRFSQS